MWGRESLDWGCVGQGEFGLGLCGAGRVWTGAVWGRESFITGAHCLLSLYLDTVLGVERQSSGVCFITGAHCLSSLYLDTVLGVERQSSVVCFITGAHCLSHHCSHLDTVLLVWSDSHQWSVIIILEPVI